MSKYIVTIPIAGSIAIEVTADSEESAKAAAWNAIDEQGESAGEIEWEFMEAVTEGNVLHAPLNEICVDKVKP